MAKKDEGKPMTPAERTDAVIKAGRYFQCVIDLGKELERIGNIEQAESEARAALSRAKAELETVTGNVSTAKEKLKDVSAKVSEKESQRLELEKQIAEAAGGLASLVASRDETIKVALQATKEAEDRAVAANAKAEKILADAAKARSELSSEKKAAREELEKRQADIALANAELSDITAKIEAAKAQIQSMFGGFGGHI